LKHDEMKDLVHPRRLPDHFHTHSLTPVLEAIAQLPGIPARIRILEGPSMQIVRNEE
jgi:hypothetical protein